MKVALDDVDRMREMKGRGYSYTRIAALTGFGIATVKRHIGPHGDTMPLARTPVRKLEARFIRACDKVRGALGMDAAEYDALICRCKGRLRSYQPETIEALGRDELTQWNEVRTLLAGSPTVLALAKRRGWDWERLRAVAALALRAASA